MIEKTVLTGQNDQFIDFTTAEAPLHEEVAPAFVRLQAMAAEAGFDLAIASAYRDYRRQMAIWNGKLSGERPVFDGDNQLMSLASLSPWQQLEAVLRWSALPGASRHHWGTDIDVYDRAAVPAGYQVQLSVEEASPQGPFGAMHDWLDKVLLGNPGLGFFRPYNVDRGGVAPERWHLSYAPVAAQYQRALTIDVIRECCERQELMLHEIVIGRLEQIMQRFISVPVSCYPEESRSIFDESQ